MESGAMVLFRAIVMLACLILVPMAAIFGSAFPNVIEACLPDSWQSVVKKSTASTPGDAPSFGPAPSHAAAAAPPAPQWPSTAPSASVPANANAAASAPVWPDTRSLEANAAPVRRSIPTATATIPDLSARANVPAAFSAPAESSNQRAGSATRAIASRDEPVSQTGDARAATAPAAGNWPTAGPANTNDRFTAIEQRLRSYGATHYHLETWGQRGELYRFQCQMPAVTRGGSSPAFEAVDASALEAMQRVLDQVETLRSTARQ